jgi:hypothetical protein
MAKVHNQFKTHCPSGHEYTEENTYRWGGRRYCIQCNRERTLRYMRERRALAKAAKQC